MVDKHYNKTLSKILKITEEKYYKIFKDKNVDEDLARSLAKDMKLKELKDGVQTIRYQLSTLQTTNGQSLLVQFILR